MQIAASLRVIAFAGLAALLTACGGSGHPSCTDEASAREYTGKFVTDMIAAAGTLSPERMKELESEFTGISGTDTTDFGAFCTKLDGIRAKYGI